MLLSLNFDLPNNFNVGQSSRHNNSIIYAQSHVKITVAGWNDWYRFRSWEEGGWNLKWGGGGGYRSYGTSSVVQGILKFQSEIKKCIEFFPSYQVK